MNEDVDEIMASIDICHSLKYIIDRVKEHKDDLSKDDVITIFDYFYIFNKDIFNDIL